MEKSPEAFRTISEVADLLDTPAHVLRFWESRFPQIRPVKRAGGRRYYRPGDVALLAGIKKLLHDDGLTIRGVQKILREQGIRHVSGLGAPLPDLQPGEGAVIDHPEDSAEDQDFLLSVIASPKAPSDTAQIIPLDQVFARQETARQAASQDDDAPQESRLEDVPEAPFMEAEEDQDSGEQLPFATHPASDAETAATPTDEVQGNLFAAADDTPDAPSETALSPPTDTGADAALSEAEKDSDDGGNEVTIAALLRRSHRARLAAHQAELARLHDRLADLRDRVAEASRRRVR
jgi:DNA-binding transcriptional MerR regulator